MLLLYGAARYACFQGRAKNEASFRTPDVDGWQPKKLTIDPDLPLDAHLQTDLPLKVLSGADCGPWKDQQMFAGILLLSIKNGGRWNASKVMLSAGMLGDNVRISGDAGLFVCNYTYFCSLRQCQRMRPGRWHALFVHVPPFDKIASKQQLQFAADLLYALAGANKQPQAVSIHAVA
jgi:pyrrolidone-carboxylate peptidase